MRTKWGSCNTEKGNIILNLELAQKPIACIEYVVAHELVHLIERHHNDNFKAHLDNYIPNWKELKKELNLLPVGCLVLSNVKKKVNEVAITFSLNQRPGRGLVNESLDLTKGKP
jgi:hypothetical protein